VTPVTFLSPGGRAPDIALQEVCVPKKLANDNAWAEVLHAYPFTHVQRCNHLLPALCKLMQVLIIQ
jgi:hypothetical protein